MNLRDTFLNLVGPHEHLWVVTTLPTDAGEVAIFNFTTRHPGSGRDDTCIVRPGEHPFLKRESIVAYGLGKMLPVDAANQNRYYFDFRQPISPALLARIQQGALESEHTPLKLQVVVRASMAAQLRLIPN